MGHGPSLLSQRLGEVIDGFDYIIRLKRCQETLKYPEQYGTKTDAICGSWTIANGLPDIGEKWVFLDSRHRNVSDADYLAAPYRMDRDLCNYWNRLYRMRRTPYKRHQQVKEFEAIGHPHLSAGFHALIYAAHFLKPEEITLAGFDNIQNGDFTWSITRGPEWDQYPDHRWDIEHTMIDDVHREFDVGVTFI